MDTSANPLSLYDPSDLELMRLAQESTLPGQNRIEEIKAFARLSGIRKIGIANCIALQKEADLLKAELEKDFEVTAVNCKTGKLPKSAIPGVSAEGIACNPAGQAAILAEAGTELNIVLGLCMGHDLIFSKKTRAPATSLIIKDRKHRHNPREALIEETGR